jgi:hypothetical protein
MSLRNTLSPGPVRPRAFLSGFVVGLVLLSILGRVVGDTNYIRGFQRFHRYLSMDTVYYATASQHLQLAEESVAAGQVLVIVGGSSVMHGVGQGSRDLWTDELQRLLGPKYLVLNYAETGTAMTDAGGVTAQMLYKAGYPFIYISDMGPDGGGDPDGLRSKYVFWDAYYKGLVPEDPSRMALLEHMESIPTARQDLEESRVRGALESVFYDTDFWNWVGYNVVFTVPSWLVRLPEAWFVAPRKLFQDPVRQASIQPLEVRYAQNPQFETDLVRGLALTVCQRDASGRLVEQPVAPIGGTLFDQRVQAALPEPVRQRTIVALMRESPYYTDRLSEEERACYFRVRPRMAERLVPYGYHPVNIGLSMTPADYRDRLHLLPSGGRIIAADLSPVVRDLSVELGYLDAETARASAEASRTEAEQFRTWLAAGGPGTEPIRQLQSQQELIREHDRRAEQLGIDAETTRRDASAARVEAERLRAQIEASGADKNPNEPANARALDGLRSQEQTMTMLDQRFQDLLRQAGDARVMADRARADLDRQCDRTEADSATLRSAPIPERAVRAQVRMLCSAS